MAGPGEYVADATQGVIRVEDLPLPRIECRSRNYRRRPCPTCGRGASRRHVYVRVMHDLGDVRSGRPVDLHATYSRHRCPGCGTHFNADTSDLGPPGSHYTHDVIRRAVRLVVEDGLGYRAASWHLWRDHRVFVPWATIQNWVEAAGEKRREAGRRRLPGLGPGRLLRLPRGR
jgi:transposase-like protein